MQNYAPVVALVGRPNVGKSTLFNGLTQTRQALVAPMPGLTRDRQYGYCQLNHESQQLRKKKKFRELTFEEEIKEFINIILIDTGGVEEISEGMPSLMRQQTEQALAEADFVLFMLDASAGVLPDDYLIANIIRTQYQKPVLVLVNKIDAASAYAAHDFYALGFKNILEIAACHAKGFIPLKEYLYTALKELALNPLEKSANPLLQKPDKKEAIYFSIVGRPNVGKSTLVNRILGEERVIVCDEAGTTRDSIFIPFERLNKKYVMIDTAGVRRKQRVKEIVEKFSAIKTLQAIQQSHVVMVVMDANEGVTDQDLRLIRYAYEQGRAIIVLMNKWDAIDAYHKGRVREDVKRSLNFIDYVEKFNISALHGSNVGTLYASIIRAHESVTRTLTSHKLTTILEKAIAEHEPPLVRGRRIKLRFAHPKGDMPPTIVIHGTQADVLPKIYQRYLENTYRKELKLVGTPIRIELVNSVNPYHSKKT